MKYKYGFKDQKIQNFFCSLFDKEKIFLMVDFTKRNFPEATYITIDPVRSGRSNYITPKLPVFMKGTELRLSFTELTIEQLYDEDDWNPYPEIEPEVDEKERWSQWLVQTKEGELKVAYYYHKVTDLLGNYQVNDIGNGWHFLKLRELEPEQNIIAFKKLPELYKENVEN